MSQPTTKSNASLSIPALLVFYLGPPGLIYASYLLSSPKIAALITLTFLPIALLYTKWRAANTTAPSRRAPLEPLLWTSVVAFLALNVLLGPLSLLTMFLMAVAFGVIDEGEGGGMLTDLSSWRTWAYVSAMALTVAVMEGAVKYLPIAYARRRRRRTQKMQLQQQQKEKAEQEQERSDEDEQQQQPPVACRSQYHGDRAYVDFALASALAMGFYEAMGNIINKKNETNGAIAMAVFERTTACTGHILWILPTALRATRRDLFEGQQPDTDTKKETMGWWNVSGPGMVLHGVNDFFAFATMALHGSGWASFNNAYILSFLRVVVLYAIGMWVARREFRLLSGDEKENENDNEKDQ